MRLYVCFFSLLLPFLVSHPALGIVKTIIVHENEEKSVSIELWCDDHYAGTAEENRTQLKLFLEKHLAANGHKKTQLFVESKFFDQIDIKKTKSSEFSLQLHQSLGWGHEGQNTFSFERSPQTNDATTWISWELPTVLMSIFHREKLPNFIILSGEQKQNIIDNLQVSLFDPRFRISQQIVNPQPLDIVKAELIENLNKVKQSSPEKFSSVIEQYGLQQISELEANNSTRNNDAPPEHATLFDLQLFTQTLAVIFNDPTQKPNKVIILCGEWHANRLDSILPSINFTKRSRWQLQPQKTSMRPQIKNSSVKRKLTFND